MNHNIPNYRKFIPKLFLLFCIFIIPISVFLSTGNLIDFNNNNFSQTLSLKINTIPSFGNVSVDNKNLGSYNSDIRIINGVSSNIKISKDNFLSEEFNIYGPKSENSIMVLDPLFLLPNKPSFVTNNSSKNIAVVRIIDKNLLIFKENNKFFVANFDFSGIKASQEIVTDKIIDKQSFDSFKKIDDKFFYLPSINSIMYNSTDKYNIKSLDDIPLKIKNLVKVNNSELLILSEDNELYSFNYINSNFDFVRSGVLNMQGFDNNNNTIFVLVKEGILILERGTETKTKVLYDLNLTFSSQVELPENIKNFQLKYVKSGLIILVNNTLYFRQSNLNSWKKISSNVHKIATNQNIVYYITNDGSLLAFRTDEQFINFLGKLQNPLQKNSTLEYSLDWSKILYYTDNYIESFSVDSNFIPSLSSSPTIVSISNIWLKDSNCYPKVVEKTQFCLDQDNLIQYRNVNLLPIL